VGEETGPGRIVRGGQNAGGGGGDTREADKNVPVDSRLEKLSVQKEFAPLNRRQEISHYSDEKGGWSGFQLD